MEHDASRLLPLLKLRSTASYSKNNYETAQVENYELTVGASRQLHEIWSLSADAGGRYTRSGFQVATFDLFTGFGTRHEQNDSKGWVLKTSLDYKGEMLQGSLAYSRDVSTSSGQFGSAVERDAVNLSLNRRLSYEFSALFGAGYYRSMAGKNQFGSQEIDESSWRGSFGLRYEFNRNVAADLGYDYYHGENTAGSMVNRNKVFFQLTAQTTLFE